jgi:hypothetical protein
MNPHRLENFNSAIDPKISSVSLVTRLRAGRQVFDSHRVQSGSEAYPASWRMGTGGYTTGA